MATMICPPKTRHFLPAETVEGQGRTDAPTGIAHAAKDSRGSAPSASASVPAHARAPAPSASRAHAAAPDAGFFSPVPVGSSPFPRFDAMSALAYPQMVMPASHVPPFFYPYALPSMAHQQFAFPYPVNPAQQFSGPFPQVFASPFSLYPAGSLPAPFSMPMARPPVSPPLPELDSMARISVEQFCAQMSLGANILEGLLKMGFQMGDSLDGVTTADAAANGIPLFSWLRFCRVYKEFVRANPRV